MLQQKIHRNSSLGWQLICFHPSDKPKNSDSQCRSKDRQTCPLQKSPGWRKLQDARTRLNSSLWVTFQSGLRPRPYHVPTLLRSCQLTAQPKARNGLHPVERCFVHGTYLAVIRCRAGMPDHPVFFLSRSNVVRGSRELWMETHIAAPSPAMIHQIADHGVLLIQALRLEPNPQMNSKGNLGLAETGSSQRTLTKTRSDTMRDTRPRRSAGKKTPVSAKPISICAVVQFPRIHEFRATQQRVCTGLVHVNRSAKGLRRQCGTKSARPSFARHFSLAIFKGLHPARP